MPAPDIRSLRRNLLLTTLPDAELERLAPLLTLRELARAEPLSEPGQQINELVFPVGAVASIVVETSDGMSVEAVLVGRDGLTGASRFLDVDRVPLRCVCQVAGDALIGSAELALDPTTPLAAAVRRYAQTLHNHSAQSAACNRLHGLAARAARWLLLTADRTETLSFGLTHEFAGVMLGSHRPSVTLALQQLQSAGGIRYTRGRVEITDRDVLLSISCECYTVLKDDYEAVMGVQFGVPRNVRRERSAVRPSAGVGEPTSGSDLPVA
jgi:hypothetical protein